MKLFKNSFVLFLVSLIGLGLFVAPAFAARKNQPDPTPKARGILNFFAKSGRVVIGDATVISLGLTGDFTVSAGGKDYPVHTDANTKFRRLFWGKGEFSDLRVDDKVNIIGTWTDDSHAAINASMVRDLSVQKRHGVFFGTIDSTNGDTFAIKTINRGDITVSTSSSTKFINRSGGAITFSDLATGQRVRVRGLWDKTAGTLTEVTEVKDFSPSAE
ncbi:DUF5666 domain-containing protein [Patescibacteria group bacterium]|nr:DUF5666 domain-containing protein [Patescibacteria group bacterium]